MICKSLGCPCYSDVLVADKCEAISLTGVQRQLVRGHRVGLRVNDLVVENWDRWTWALNTMRRK